MKVLWFYFVTSLIAAWICGHALHHPFATALKYLNVFSAGMFLQEIAQKAGWLK